MWWCAGEASASGVRGKVSIHADVRSASSTKTYLLVAAVEELEMLKVLLKLLPMLLRSRSRSLLERNLIVV